MTQDNRIPRTAAISASPTRTLRKIWLLLPALLLTPFSAQSADHRWTSGWGQGTSEASIDNRNNSSVTISCPAGQEDTTPSFLILVKRVQPKSDEPTPVQIVVDGVRYPFDSMGLDIMPRSRPEKLQFRAVLNALASSKSKTFVIEFPTYKTSETFSLLDAQKVIGQGKNSIIEDCGASKW